MVERLGSTPALPTPASTTWPTCGQHPQLQARQRWRTVGTPVGEVPALLPPGVNSAFDYRMDAVPAVGQHNASILAELGWSTEQIAAVNAAQINSS